MLLPDLFDEKVALMAQEEEEMMAGRTTAQEGEIARNPGHLVTFFTNGSDGSTQLRPVNVVLDDGELALRRTKAAVANAKSYQASRIILHAPATSDYQPPQLTDKLRERGTTNETGARALPSFITNAVKRRPWALGLAAPQPLPPPVLAPTVANEPSAASRRPPGLGENDERATDVGVDSEDGAEDDDRSDRIPSKAPDGWLGGVTRWASRFWGVKRAERSSSSVGGR